jgi:hypothetical protein
VETPVAEEPETPTTEAPTTEEEAPTKKVKLNKY